MTVEEMVLKYLSIEPVIMGDGSEQFDVVLTVGETTWSVAMKATLTEAQAVQKEYGKDLAKLVFDVMTSSS